MQAAVAVVRQLQHSSPQVSLVCVWNGWKLGICSQQWESPVVEDADHFYIAAVAVCVFTSRVFCATAGWQPDSRETERWKSTFNQHRLLTPQILVAQWYFHIFSWYLGTFLLPSSQASWPLPGPTCLASGLGSVAGEEQGAGAEAHRARGCRDGMWGQCGGTRTGWMVGRRFLRFLLFSLFSFVSFGVWSDSETRAISSPFAKIPSRQLNPRLLRPEVRRVIEMLLDNDWPGPWYRISQGSKVPLLRSIGGPLDPKKLQSEASSSHGSANTAALGGERSTGSNPGRCRFLWILGDLGNGRFLLDPMVTPIFFGWSPIQPKSPRTSRNQFPVDRTEHFWLTPKRCVPERWWHFKLVRSKCRSCWCSRGFAVSPHELILGWLCWANIPIIFPLLIQWILGYHPNIPNPRRCDSRNYLCESEAHGWLGLLPMKPSTFESLQTTKYRMVVLLQLLIFHVFPIEKILKPHLDRIFHCKTVRMTTRDH